MNVALLAGLLALLLPLSGGGWRDDHLALAGIALGVGLLLGPGLPVRNRAFAAVVAAVALLLADIALRAVTSPAPDLAMATLVLAIVAVAAFAMGAMSNPMLLADAMSAGCGALAVLSILHHARSGGNLGAGLVWPFANHAQLGGVLAAGAVLAFVIPDPNRKRKSVWDAGTGLRLGLCAFLSVAVAATQSRSAFLALAAALIAAALIGRPRSFSFSFPYSLAFRVYVFLSVFVFKRKAKTGTTTRNANEYENANENALARATLGVATLALLALAVLWVGAASRWETTAGSPAVADRLMIWEATIRLFETAPFFGRGLGSYGSAIWLYTPEALGGAIEHAHSMPLEVLAERGLTGALSGALALFVLLRAASLRRRLLLGALVPLIQSTLDVSFSTPGLVLLVAALLGAAAAPAEETPRRAPTRWASGLVGVATIVVCGLWTHRTMDRSAADAAMERGDRAAMLDASRRAVARWPADRRSARRLAEGDRRAEDVEALRVRDPADPFAALGMAVVHEREGALDAAEAELTRAIALFPGGFAPRRAHLDFLVRHGRLVEAVDLARSMADAHPARAVEIVLAVAGPLDNPLLAETLAPAGDVDRGRLAEWALQREHPDSALRLAPVGDRFLRARAFAALGRTAEARDALRGILIARFALDGAPPRTPIDAGSALLLADLAERDPTPAAIDEALAALAQVLSRGDDPACTGRFLSLLDRAGRPEEAERWLDERVAREPDRVHLLERRQERRLRTGNIAGAMADAQRQIELRPRDAGGRLALARLYEQRQLLGSARELYLEALDLSPGNAEAMAALARLANEKTVGSGLSETRTAPERPGIPPP